MFYVFVLFYLYLYVCLYLYLVYVISIFAAALANSACGNSASDVLPKINLLECCAIVLALVNTFLSTCTKLH